MKGKRWLWVALGGAAVLAGVAAFVVLRPRGQHADPDFHPAVARPAYPDRHPRVLFDEAHNNFHTTRGRYRPFVELLTRDGYEVRPNGQQFSAQALAGTDVLVIANARGTDEQGAQAAFTEEECAAVRAWVEAGGSVLLIVDHYPFGPAAANLARRFGVELSAGLVEDPKHHNPGGDPTELLFSRENGLLADHTITRGRNVTERVSRVVTFTGTSLKEPPAGVAFLRLADTARDLAPEVRVEQSGNDTVTIINYKDPVSAAGRAQGLALEVGRGRVVVMGEAASLTAQLDPDGNRFGMNVPGLDNQQFALNILHWLSRLLD